jgi:CBS domain containing-hemolysin-like protein
MLVLGAPVGILFVAAQAEAESLPGLSMLIAPLSVIILLVLLNGLFVAGEFAIIGVRPSRIDELVDDGNNRAKAVQKILDSNRRQDSYIATAQLGITIASLGLGMYGEPQIAHFIEPYLARLVGIEPTPLIVHTLATLIALGFLTYLHVVVGEMVPKSLALAAAERAVLALVVPMRVAQAVLQIPVRILNSIGRGLLRVLGIPPATGHARLHSSEELELIVAESAEGGLLNEGEEEMILNIFDFSDRQVGQVMTPRRKVQAIPHDTPLEELRQILAASSFSRFPVYEEDLDHVVGILHLKDLVRYELHQHGPFDIDLLLRGAPAVPESQPVEELLAAFKRERLHMAIVLDEFGGMAGIVTLEDLIEEIVGEVRDEFDLEREPIVEIRPGELEVSGAFLLDDLADYVYLGEEEELPDVETVGGLIVTRLGRPPHASDEVKVNEVSLTVLDVDGRAVARARIVFPTPPAESDDPD